MSGLLILKANCHSVLYLFRDVSLSRAAVLEERIQLFSLKVILATCPLLAGYTYDSFYVKYKFLTCTLARKCLQFFGFTFWFLLFTTELTLTLLKVVFTVRWTNSLHWIIRM
jgi:hypothetical protein